MSSQKDVTTSQEPFILHLPTPDVLIPEMDIWSFLSARLKSCPSCNMFDATSGAKFSYLDIVNFVEKIAAHYQAFGMKPGVKVVFLASNSAAALFSYLAVCAVGATIVPITMAYSASSDDFLELATMTDCSYCIFSSDYMHQGLAFRNKFRQYQKPFLIDGIHEDFICVENLLKQNSSTKYQTPTIDPKKDILCIVFTSGTTGKPKAIMHNHQSIVASIVLATQPQMILITPDDAILVFAPLVHGSGLFMMLSTLSVGAGYVLAKSSTLNPNSFIELIGKYKITNLMIFPTMFTNLIKSLNPTTKIPSVKKITVGGSPFAESLATLIRRYFINLTELRQVYALSEVLSIVTASPRGTKDASTIGIVSPNTKIKIIDPETGKTLPKGSIGEICILSPCAMIEYMNNPTATAAAFDKDGYYRSGDLGYINENDHVVIVDRIKAMIKCMDYQVSPAELEDVLLKDKSVREVAVVGYPMEEFGEAPTACVLLSQGVKPSDALKKELLTLVNECGGHHSKRLHGGVYFFDSLPKTQSGKYVKKELLRMIENEKNREILSLE